jgi:hypothetical protein
MNRRRIFVLLLLLLLLLVAATTNPLIKALLLCRWRTQRLVAAADTRGCISIAATYGRCWRTSQAAARRWGCPSNAAARGWCRRSMAAVEHSLGPAPWRMTMAGRWWPLLGEDSRDRLPPTDEDERGWRHLETTVPGEWRCFRAPHP